MSSSRTPPFVISSGRGPGSAATLGPQHEGEPHRTTIEAAFRDERSQLMRYLERRAGQDAPDLMQEVFLRAVGSDQAKKLTNPAAFLQRIARNLLIDRARKHVRDNVVLFPLEDQDIGTPPAQEWALEAGDLYALYEAAIASLPDKTRHVFHLHRVEELSYREIHQRLGISIATVEYHMIKALAHIARHVDAAR